MLHVLNRNFLGLRSAFVALFAAASFAPWLVSAQVCPFDSGGSTLTNDGLVLTRYALGFRGEPLVANTAFAVSQAPTIESNIACPACGLRVTDDRDALGNPIFTPTDATIISRKLAGFGGTQLTNGLSLGSGTRNTPTAVQSFLLSGCGTTGGTVTGITAGTGLTGGTITASGTIAADTAFLQRRISNACPAGRFVTAVAADGTTTCSAPPAGGVGTVTSVSTGSGITGGPITESGTLSLASGYALPQTCAAGQVVKSAGPGSWSCGADNVGTAPVFPTCFDGQILRFGSGGSLICASLPPAPVLVQQSSGDYPTLMIASDGLPIFAYRNFVNAPSVTARVEKCTKPDCSGARTSPGEFGVLGATEFASYIAGAISPLDGLAVFSLYNGNANPSVLVVKCTSVDCATVTLSSVDAQGGANVGKFTSIAVPADGRPVISYYDQSNGNLKIAKCGNADCSAGNTSTAVDTAGDVGQHTSIAISADGFPVVSYQNVTSGTLKVLKCTVATCATGNITSTPDSVNGAGVNTSIAVPPDGLPVISYYESTNGNLKVLKCGNASCNAASNTIAAVDTLGDVGRASSLKIAADGFPIISYYDTTNTSLKVVKCGNATCSAGNTISTLDDSGTAGIYSSIAVPNNGYPIVAYYDGNSGLKILKCTNSACTTTP